MNVVQMAELHDDGGSIGVNAITVNGRVEGWYRWSMKGGYQTFRADGKKLGMASTYMKAMQLVEHEVASRDD